MGADGGHTHRRRVHQEGCHTPARHLNRCNLILNSLNTTTAYEGGTDAHDVSQEPALGSLWVPWSASSVINRAFSNLAPFVSPPIAPLVRLLTSAPALSWRLQLAYMHRGVW